MGAVSFKGTSFHDLTPHVYFPKMDGLKNLPVKDRQAFPPTFFHNSLSSHLQQKGTPLTLPKHQQDALPPGCQHLGPQTRNNLKFRSRERE